MLKRSVVMTALIALALAVVPAGAQDVSEGQWINLFDGETTFGWNTLGHVETSVEDGMLVLDNSSGGWLANNVRFKDFEMKIKLRVIGEGSLGVVARGALDGHWTENGSYVYIVNSAKKDKDWKEITIKAVGDKVTAQTEGKSEKVLEGSLDRGHVGIQYHRKHSAPYRVEIESIKLRPLGLKSIFNGKDLDGWNIIPDRASIFTVVDSAINIKDGNGQIETADTFQDFVLQLDVISNGTELNSGVFFRGPVGVFWKGYESQVRNHWAGDRTKPVDFGTGGLYGVQSTRKVVSTDGKWFNKTVIADGNRIAVWIDGYQTSSILDMRRTIKNADGKNGYVPAAGTIHLQGHDPTTDLSFKNINVQEY